MSARDAFWWTPGGRHTAAGKKKPKKEDLKASVRGVFGGGAPLASTRTPRADRDRWGSGEQHKSAHGRHEDKGWGRGGQCITPEVKPAIEHAPGMGRDACQECGLTPDDEAPDYVLCDNQECEVGADYEAETDETGESE